MPTRWMTTLSAEEIAAAVAEAHRWGRTVAIHCQSFDAAKFALRAGADTIEHGTRLDDEALALFARVAHGAGADAVHPVQRARAWGDPEPHAEAARGDGRQQGPLACQRWRAPARPTLPIGAGSDIGNRYPHGRNAREIEFLVRAGLSPMQALKAATGTAARILGKEGTVGALTPGAFADLLVVDGDPLEDVRVLQDRRRLHLIATRRARGRRRDARRAGGRAEADDGVGNPRMGWSSRRPAPMSAPSARRSSSKATASRASHGAPTPAAWKVRRATRPSTRARALVIPGLVDAHSHFYGTLIPGLIDRLAARRPMAVPGRLHRWLDGARHLGATTMLGVLRMLKNGTTTVLENVRRGIDATVPAIRAIIDSGVRAVVGPMVSDRPFGDTMPGYVERLPECAARRGAERGAVAARPRAGGALPRDRSPAGTALRVASPCASVHGRRSVAPTRCSTLVAEASATHSRSRFIRICSRPDRRRSRRGACTDAPWWSTSRRSVS